MADNFTMLDHTADIKFKVSGANINEVFQNSTLAFASYISPDKKIKPLKKKLIKLKAEDKESLLYNFLDNLIYLLDAESFAAAKSVVKIGKDEKSLSAEIIGDSVGNYNLTHIKAATYAEMSIKKLKSGSWEAQFVLDV